MAATVPAQRFDIGDSEVRAGRVVRAATWRDLALVTNWTLGRGAMLIPGYMVNVGLSASTEYEFKFRVRPRSQALERVWCIQSRVTSATPASIKVEVPSGATSVDLASAPGRPFGRGRTLVTETLSSQSATEGELTLAITPQTNGVTIESISCWEVPRAELVANSTDDGTDITQINSGQPMRGSTVAQLAKVYADETQIGRRVSLLQWAVPVTAGGATSTSFAKAITATSYTDLFDLPVPILARKIGRSATTGTVTCKLLAWVNGGTADARLTSSVNGSGGNANISATTPTWTSAFTLGVDCEDLDGADGRQTSGSPTWDELDIQVRKNTSGTLYIAAASIWEA